MKKTPNSVAEVPKFHRPERNQDSYNHMKPIYRISTKITIHNLSIIYSTLYIYHIFLYFLCRQFNSCSPYSYYYFYLYTIGFKLVCWENHWFKVIRLTWYISICKIPISTSILDHKFQPTMSGLIKYWNITLLLLKQYHIMVSHGLNFAMILCAYNTSLRRGASQTDIYSRRNFPYKERSRENGL